MLESFAARTLLDDDGDDDDADGFMMRNTPIPILPDIRDAFEKKQEEEEGTRRETRYGKALTKWLFDCEVILASVPFLFFVSSPNTLLSAQRRDT